MYTTSLSRPEWKTVPWFFSRMQWHLGHKPKATHLMFLNRKVTNFFIISSQIKKNRCKNPCLKVLDISLSKRTHIFLGKSMSIFILEPTKLKLPWKLQQGLMIDGRFYTSLSNTKRTFDFFSKSEMVFKWPQSLLRFNLCLNYKGSENLEMQITFLPLGNCWSQW